MVIVIDDIISTMSKAFIDAKLPAFTIRNLETHLEDFNILNDKEQDSDSLTYINFGKININVMFNQLADTMSHLGYEASFSIFNSLRFLFKENDEVVELLTIESWLKIVRKVISTVNTTLRYKGVLVDV